jgi:hypothetical protein
VCGVDRGDHDCVEGEEPGTCYLVPCEEHLIPVEGAGPVEGDGAVEVWTQTDAPAEVPTTDLLDINILMMIKKKFDLKLEKMKAEFSSLTACDDDGTPRWELMDFAKKCYNCDAAYIQKEDWQTEIAMYDDIEAIYDDIETIYKKHQEPEEKKWNCLCVNCCVKVRDGDLNDIAAAKKKQLADAVEQLRISLVSEYEEGAAKGAHCECCMGGWGVHLKSGWCHYRECDLCEGLFRDGTFCGTCGEVW